MSSQVQALRSVQTDDKNLNMVQSNIADVLYPIIKNPLTSGILLTNISLAAGDNIISHKLGRSLIGWIPVRVRASATIYDKQDSNGSASTTLKLNASAAVVVDLFLF
jgi:hypothetical protein